MIATKEQAAEAMRALFGSENPSTLDLTEREYEFVQGFINPLLTQPAETDCVLDMLDEYDPIGSDHEEDWVTPGDIAHRLQSIIDAMDGTGRRQEPDALAQAFEARYIPGNIEVITKGTSDCVNDIMLIVTSWNDIAVVMQEYNRRYNRSRYNLWNPILTKIAKESDTFPWADMELGIDENKNLVHKSQATLRYNQLLKRDELWTKQVHGLVDLDDLCDVGFNDSYRTCTLCESLISMQPDGPGWQPSFFELDGEIFCSECVKTENEVSSRYLEEHLNKNALVNTYLLDPDDYDYVQVPSGFATGLHSGQNDSPEKVIEALDEIGVSCLFTGNVGQFDVNWSVWVNGWSNIVIGAEHSDILTKLVKDVREGTEIDKRLENADDKDEQFTEWVSGYLHDYGHHLPYSPAEEMKNALSGKGSDHVKVQKIEVQDGVVTVDPNWKE